MTPLETKIQASTQHNRSQQDRLPAILLASASSRAVAADRPVSGLGRMRSRLPLALEGKSGWW